ncbi:hypothetical protein M0805_007023 [Coniferiporia weirii]|nr:hypothetical protein M0805_007023 [Coniferiporia weirii]
MATHTTVALDTAPPVHRIKEGTRSIDRDAFRKSVQVLAARVPAAKTGNLLRAGVLRKSILDLPKIRSVVLDGESDDRRLVLLKAHTKDDLPAEAIKYLDSEGASFSTHAIDLDYNYWTADEILQATLPEELCDGSPTGFAATGHLAHLNLNDEYLPFKNIIGQVIMDKNSRIRTVVNKLDSIHDQFRFFEMELIAGEPEFIVEHLESDCRFTFDFREVYWNSRLHTEHERLVQQFEPKDGIVADVMAGVGPFAVPAAKKGCAVLANDLNPNCEKWHRVNVANNNVSDNLRVYCEDGREFIRTSFKRAFLEPFPPYAGKKASKRQLKEERRRRQEKTVPWKSEGLSSSDDSAPSQPIRNRIAHFVMNLPDTAIEFLDAFRGVLKATDRELSGLYETMPMIHCHCFTRFLELGDAEADIRKRVEATLGGKLEDATLHFVRSVAPNKDMYCISFRLPRRVAYAQ